jgi:SOS-response transcriptional repressor LexA
MTARLTWREREALLFIRDFKARYLYAPTLREIAAGLGLSSASVANYRVHALREKGLLTFVAGEPRTIVLREEREERTDAEKDYYIMADLQGCVAVTIRARSKRAALERLSNGSWDEVWDVSLKTVGAVHVEATPVER